MRERSLQLLATMAMLTTGCFAEESGYYSYSEPNEPRYPPEHTAETINPWIDTAEETQSTFAIDVDTGSYTLTRGLLQAGSTPSANEVRVEEFVNFFRYEYDEPAAGPFAVDWEAAPSYFDEGKVLLRVGIQGLPIRPEDRLPANLVFLIDVSGSMQGEGRLPLVKEGLSALVANLSDEDTIGIVVYAGTEGEALPPTPVSRREEILDVIQSLGAGGSTNGESGIIAAYRMAEEAFIPGGINRVILATDGDFNVGLTGDALIELVETKRESGITLTTLGFGTGNYQDGQLEGLADHGNGNYAYIDSLREAERVFGERLVSTLQVIAKDVKLQLEFNPEVVARFRLIGYDNRVLENEDFRNDERDAGEIGPDHQVTAFYELELVESVPDDATERSLATLRIRHKEPEGDVATESTFKISVDEIVPSFDEASVDFRFAAAVAEFAEVLRNSPHRPTARLGDVIRIVESTSRELEDRLEFMGLVQAAVELRQ